MKKGFAMLLVIVSLLTVSNWVVAKDSRILSGKIALNQNGYSQLEQLNLKVPVGKVDVRVADGDVIEYQVEVEKDSSSWSLFPVDLDSVKISEKIAGQALYLEIAEEDISQKWVLTVPKEVALDFTMGVGNLDVDSFSQSLSADIGVGSAWVSVNSTDYGRVAADVGVGEIQITGFEQDAIHRERVIVAEQIRYSGQGNHKIDIDVGVGDINLSRQVH